MSSSLPTIAFLTTSLLIIVYERRKRRSGASAKGRKPASSLTKEQVIQLREKHFMKAVSVSYANSGGLLIIGVGKST
jgi:4-aminobutyrate aminotransferase-like enzyme